MISETVVTVSPRFPDPTRPGAMVGSVVSVVVGPLQLLDLVISFNDVLPPVPFSI